jgi:hypothetical protein
MFAGMAYRRRSGRVARTIQPLAFIGYLISVARQPGFGRAASLAPFPDHNFKT